MSYIWDKSIFGAWSLDGIFGDLGPILKQILIERCSGLLRARITESEGLQGSNRDIEKIGF